MIEVIDKPEHYEEKRCGLIPIRVLLWNAIEDHAKVPSLINFWSALEVLPTLSRIYRDFDLSFDCRP